MSHESDDRNGVSDSQAAADVVGTGALQTRSVDDCVLASMRYTAIALVLLALLAALVGIGAPAAILLWRAHAPTVVLQEGPAGNLVSARVETSFVISDTVTHLVTTLGDMTVHGAFSGPRGARLAFRRDNKTPGLQVCAVDAATTCAGLVGSWSGELHITPEAAHAINFVRHGWTDDGLSTWMVFGVGAVFIVVLMGIVLYLVRGNYLGGNEDDAESSEDE